jgi:uncharacterized protein
VILVDTGPLVALVYRNDVHHRRCVEATRGFHDALGTVWPVVTEAMHLLHFSLESREGVWQLLESQEIEVLDLRVADVGRIRALMRKYRDLPMGFADAALVRVGEREGARTVFTLDRRDFSVYRPAHTSRFTVVP